MPLDDPAIKKALNSRGEKTTRLFDSGGLYLEIPPSGGETKARWRFKYRFEGKENRISLGVYPDVPIESKYKKDKDTDENRKIKGARTLRDEYRDLLAQGIDPSANKKAVKASKGERAPNCFETVAREWFDRHAPNWKENHSSKIMRRMEVDLFPWLGTRPIGEVTAPELLAAIRRIESRGALETAHRALANCGQVFRYAVATGRAQRDTAADLRGSLPPVKEKHHASITDPKAIGELLRDIEGYQGAFVTRCALRLAPLVFLRPGELRKAEWAEIDLDKAEWRIPAARMKMNVVHIVPLASQAVEILRELHPLTGSGKYVFPGARTATRPMSENAVLSALRRLGYTTDEMTGHGFRSMASTLLNEQGFNRDAIERQLAHAERDGVRAAYNYAEYLPERKRMMQAWADYLGALKAGAQIIPLRANSV